MTTAVAERAAAAAGSGPQDERAFTAQVVRTLRTCGWTVYHPWISIHSESGWPDIAAVRDGVLLTAELKLHGRRPTAVQRHWLAELGRVPGVLALVLTPDDDALLAYVAARGTLPPVGWQAGAATRREQE